MADTEDRKHLLFRRGSWHFNKRVKGRIDRRSLGTDNVEKARKERDKILRSLSRPAPSISLPTPASVEKMWDDAARAFIKERLYDTASYSPATAKRYEVSIGQLTPTFAGDRLSAITTDTLLDYVIARKDDGASASTVKNDLTCMSMVFKHAKTRRWCTHNPAAEFDREAYLASDVEPLAPPTDAQLAAVLTEVEKWSSDMALLLRWLRETGMRLTEALLLRRAHILNDGKQARLTEGVKRNRKQGLKTRVVWLGRAADLLPSLGQTDRLFENLSTSPQVVSTRYGQWWRQEIARQGRASHTAPHSPLHRFRLHDLRHAFAMASLVDYPNRQGELREHLGHAHLTTTDGYTVWMRGEGYSWRDHRDRQLFGSLPSPENATVAA